MKTIIIIGAGAIEATELLLAIATLHSGSLHPVFVEEVPEELMMEKEFPIELKHYEDMVLQEIFIEEVPKSYPAHPTNTTIRAQQIPIKRQFRTQHKS